MSFAFPILWTVCGYLSVPRLEGRCPGEPKNSMEPRQASPLKLKGASPGDIPKTAIEKQLFGDLEDGDYCEGIRKASQRRSLSWDLEAAWAA